MDFVVVKGDSQIAFSNEQPLIEVLKCHFVVGSAWLSRHLRSSRHARKLICAAREHMVKRRYVMSIQTCFSC